MGHVGALCPDRPGFCPVFGIDQWFQWALHNRDIVSQNESLNPISGTDFRVKKKLPHGPGWRDFFSGLALATRSIALAPGKSCADAPLFAESLVDVESERQR